MIGIDLTKPPKNFRDAIYQGDACAEEWRQAYAEEFQGFTNREAFAPVYPSKLAAMG